MTSTSLGSTSISAFPVSPTGHVVLTEDQFQALLDHIAHLEDRIESLEARHDREEVTAEAAPPSPEMPAMKARVGLLDMRLDDAFEAISEIDSAIAKLSRPAGRETGPKSAQRIARIEAILKDRGGTVAFKTLRRELSLKPNQFSALIKQIDKRRFIVGVNPRAKDEKFLRLRAFT